MSPLVLGLALLATPGDTDPAPTSIAQPAAEVVTNGGPAPASSDAAPAPATAEEAQRIAENEAIIRMAEGEFQDVDVPTHSEEPVRSLLGAFIQMVVVLTAVCLLAYLLLGKVLPRLMRVRLPDAPQRVLKIIDRVPLDQRGALLVVAVGETYFLVGVSQGGIHLISRLEADSVSTALANTPAPAPGFPRWAQALLPKRRKER